MKSLQSKDNLVWLDLEMTGLDPEKERIIEIATLITDSKLNILAEGPNLIIKQQTPLLDQMDEWNQNQHGSSGLIDAVKKSSITEQMAEIETLDFVSKYVGPNQSPMCGNTVSHDRKSQSQVTGRLVNRMPASSSVYIRTSASRKRRIYACLSRYWREAPRTMAPSRSRCSLILILS